MTTAVLSVDACDGTGWWGQLDLDQLPSGTYSGSFTSTLTQPSPDRQAIGMISEEFEAHFLLVDQHYAGAVAVDGAVLSGNMIEYRGRQGVFLGFDGLSTISLDGEVNEREGMSGTYSGEGAEGRFALTYSGGYEDGSSFDRLSGIWTYSESSSGGAVYTITLELDGNGRLFGSDTAGCIFSAQLRIIDERYSVYSAAITVSMCGDASGDYSGLALYPDAGAVDMLYVGADNGQFACAIQVERL